MARILVFVLGLAVTSALAYRLILGHGAAPAAGSVAAEIGMPTQGTPQQQLDHMRQKAKAIEAEGQKRVDDGLKTMDEISH